MPQTDRQNEFEEHENRMKARKREIIETIVLMILASLFIFVFVSLLFPR